MNKLFILLIVAMGVAVSPAKANFFTDAVFAIKGHVEDVKSRTSDDLIKEGKVLRIGMFNEDAIGSDTFHNGSGTVTVRTADGERFVQLESDFTSTPGPDYYVYASATPFIETIEDFDNAVNVVELGKLLKGSGASFYAVPNDDVQVSSITIVCKKFHVFITSSNLIIGETL